jgi:hypothetical protein
MDVTPNMTCNTNVMFHVSFDNPGFNYACSCDVKRFQFLYLHKQTNINVKFVHKIDDICKAANNPSCLPSMPDPWTLENMLTRWLLNSATKKCKYSLLLQGALEYAIYIYHIVCVRRAITTKRCVIQIQC